MHSIKNVEVSIELTEHASYELQLVNIIVIARSPVMRKYDSRPMLVEIRCSVAPKYKPLNVQ